MASLSFSDRDAWQARLPGLLTWAAVLLAAVWCGWMALQLAWAILTPLDSGTSSAPRSTAAPRQASAPVMDIGRWHLLGNGQAEQTRREVYQASRATQLNLTLFGTVTAADGQGGHALIADASGATRSYRVGERIQDGVHLRAVHATWVLLDHNGENERLELPRDDLAGAAAVRPLPANTARNPAARAAAAPRAGNAPLFVAPRMNAARVDWRKLQDSFQRDPMQAAADMKLTPVFEGTQLRGVRVGSTASPLLAGSGLHSDDVVTAVNGTPLDSVARGQQLLEKLQGADHVQLTVLRDGRSQTIDIDLGKAH